MLIHLEASYLPSQFNTHTHTHTHTHTFIIHMYLKNLTNPSVCDSAVMIVLTHSGEISVRVRL